MISRGQGGSGFIVPSSESGPSDQTDIDRVVFLEVLGRWSMIPELHPDWSRGRAGALRTRAGALSLRPLVFRFGPVASGVF